MATPLSPANTLKKLGAIDDATAKKIADLTFQVLLDPKVENSLTGDAADAQISLATLIAIFVRQGAPAETLHGALKDGGVSDAVATHIVGLYRQNVDTLRAECANIALAYNRITGCDWRLDYAVSNSESGSVLLPIFFVKIKLEGGRAIDFSCTEEEMTALVAALKDAISEAGRTAQ